MFFIRIYYYVYQSYSLQTIGIIKVKSRFKKRVYLIIEIDTAVNCNSQNLLYYWVLNSFYYLENYYD